MRWFSSAIQASCSVVFVNYIFTLLQQGRQLPSKNVSRIVPNSRNYWWSSSSAAPSTSAQNSEAISPDGLKTSPEQSSASNPVSSEPSSTTPDVSEESAVQSSQTAGPVEPASSLDTVVADTPLDTPIPDLLPPPLQYGDFAELGLSGWTPSGIAAWTFEVVQVTTGMPWFYTIIAGTLFWRFGPGGAFN